MPALDHRDGPFLDEPAERGDNYVPPPKSTLSVSH